MKVALISWNPFQLLHFKNIMSLLDNVTAFIVDKGNNLNLFNDELLAGFDCKVKYIAKSDIPKIDGSYDIVLYQSPFPLMEKFETSKLVSLQYGLAKQRHNYGEWRSLSDMNLMYGDYSKDRVSHFSPSYSVGNPKFDSWNLITDSDVKKFKAEHDFDLNKKTILYMPTWGALGSFNNLIYTLGRLNIEYNVVVKMHHNNDLRLKSWIKKSEQSGIKLNFEGHVDPLLLLKSADVVVSDFSGAIFDALYVDVPVVLYQEFASDLDGIQNFGLSSLEYKSRNEIGYCCEEKDKLKGVIDNALDLGSKKSAIKMKLDLFTFDNVSASRLIVDKLDDLYANRIPPLTTPQLYVREQTKLVRELKIKVNKLTKKKVIVNKLLLLGMENFNRLFHHKR